MKVERNSYHLVDSSPWSFVVSTYLMLTITGILMFMHGLGSLGIVVLGIVLVLIGIGNWMKDIVREGSYEGQHVFVVVEGIRLGFILFVVSEVMFFFGFFFSYFWLSLGSNVWIGSVWIPVGIVGMEGLEVPLLNTIILLGSGIAVTWSQYGIYSRSRSEAVSGVVICIGLAIIFTGLQGYEYLTSSFSISDSSYGSIFYILTGFHGIHVIVGTVMLIVALIRIVKYEVTAKHNVGMEVAAIYWHFVDVVWLMVFVIVYIGM